MTQSLVINGKEYLPSSVLATRFGYTSDYIGKLAREEKILGTLIGRQWFVEPQSLSVFLTQAEIAKKMRQEELRMQRKLERQTHQEKNLESRKVLLARELNALAQTAVVVLCGLMLGGLGFVAFEARVSGSELADGAHETFSFIAQAILPTERTTTPSYALVAATAEGTHPSVQVPKTPLIFTSLPQFPERTMATSSASSEHVALSRFSDEVRVIENGDGSEMIVPVFKSGNGGSDFLLVPVNEHTQYHE